MSSQYQNDGRMFRRGLSAMAAMALVCYVTAFVQSDRGTVHYNRYVQAYTTCYEDMLEAGATQADCRMVPEVRTQLAAHRQAFAVGESFLNLALSLTLVMFLSPLIRRLVCWLIEVCHLRERIACTQCTPRSQSFQGASLSACFVSDS